MNGQKKEDTDKSLAFLEVSKDNKFSTGYEDAFEFSTDDKLYDILMRKVYKEEFTDLAFRRLTSELKRFLRVFKNPMAKFQHVQFLLDNFMGPRLIIWKEDSIIDTSYLSVWKSYHPDSIACKLRILARVQDRKGEEYEFAMDKLDAILAETDEEDLFDKK